MADYRKLVPFIKKWEGGFSNHPQDRGGATNKGVTLTTYRMVYGKDKTVDDLKNMTESQWNYIFKKLYWDKWKADYEALIQKQKDEADLAELNGAIDKAIENAKGKDAVSIRAHLDMDAIKASKNRDKDIETAIKALAEGEKTSFLFTSTAEEEQAQFTSPQGAQPPKAEVHNSDLRAAFGLPAEK